MKQIKHFKFLETIHTQLCSFATIKNNINLFHLQPSVNFSSVFPSTNTRYPRNIIFSDTLQNSYLTISKLFLNNPQQHLHISNGEICEQLVRQKVFVDNTKTLK